MTARDDFDRLVSLWLDEEAGGAEPAYLADVLARVDETDQRRWRTRWGQLGARALPRPSILVGAGVRTGLVLGLLAAVILGATIAAGLQPRLPVAANGLIAYSSHGNIYVADADGRNPRVLVGTTSDDAEPAWSPDGTMLAYFTGPSRTRIALWVVGADGSGARLLLDGVVPGTVLAWSPDSRRIAIPGGLRMTPGGTDDRNGEIRIVDVTDGHVETIDTGSVHLTTVAWSPAGHELAGAGAHQTTGSGVFVLSVDGSRLETVTPPHTEALFDLANAVVPSWSPDGMRLTYAAPFAATTFHSSVIVATRGDGGWGRSAISNQPPEPYLVDDVHPVWSRDGERIAFLRIPSAIRTTGPDPFENEPYLFVVNPDGSNRYRLDREALVAVRPCWSPDDRIIGVHGRSPGTTTLRLVDAHAGGTTARVELGHTDTPVTSACSWQRLP